MKLRSNTMIALSVLGGGIGLKAEEQNTRQPNFVVFITDQQQNTKLSWYGEPGLDTPTMDRIAGSGYSFMNAYCAFPLSIPQRFSLFTGMYPSSVNLRFNPGKTDRNLVAMDAIESMQPDMLANLFNNAGYDTFYGGKAHLVSREINEDPKFYGFRNIYSTDRRNLLGADAAALIDSKSPDDKPFLMVVSYINPHDICEFDDYVVLQEMEPKVRARKADGISRVSRYINDTYRWSEDVFYDSLCPPLPANHAVMKGEPAGMPGKTGDYTEREWRMHRWVYNRLIEEVDSDMAPVMRALERGGFMDNTYIIFMSDHGDMDASHCREHKSVPYEEAQKVPFIISGPGIGKGVKDTRTAINTGIDFLPTICDLAGIKIPDKYPGISVKAAAMGKQTDTKRRDIFCEGKNWYQIIEDGRYKYTIMESKGNPVILVDLKTDPGESRNLTGDPDYHDIEKRLDRKLRNNLTGRNLKILEQ